MSEYIKRDKLLALLDNAPTAPITDREGRIISAVINAIKIFPAAIEIDKSEESVPSINFPGETLEIYDVTFNEILARGKPLEIQIKHNVERDIWGWWTDGNRTREEKLAECKRKWEREHGDEAE